MFVWIEAIRELYRLNAARLEVWDETLPLALQPSAFAERHHDLETKLSQMRACYQAHLQEPSLHLAKQKVLSSLHTHWAIVSGSIFAWRRSFQMQLFEMGDQLRFTG